LLVADEKDDAAQPLSSLKAGLKSCAAGAAQHHSAKELHHAEPKSRLHVDRIDGHAILAGRFHINRHTGS